MKKALFLLAIGVVLSFSILAFGFEIPEGVTFLSSEEMEQTRAQLFPSGTISELIELKTDEEITLASEKMVLIIPLSVTKDLFFISKRENRKFFLKKGSYKIITYPAGYPKR